MSEIRFYHLQTQPLERALPAILTKILSGNRRAVVRLADAAQIKHFDEHLWTYSPDSFLPHGSGTAHADKQPVYLTDRAENPNGADVLILAFQENVPENLGEFALCCDFLDGQDGHAVTLARARWKAYKDAGHTVTYWQQTETGGWEQKA